MTYLKALGATHILDRDAPLSSLAASVKDITREPIRIIYDAVSSSETQNAGYDLLAPEGTIVIVTGNAVEESRRTSNKRIADIYGSPFVPDRREVAVDLYKHIPELFASGELKVRSLDYSTRFKLSISLLQPNHVEVIPGGLAGIPVGLEKFKNGQVHALKLTVHPQETP